MVQEGVGLKSKASLITVYPAGKMIGRRNPSKQTWCLNLAACPQDSSRL